MRTSKELKLPTAELLAAIAVCSVVFPPAASAYLDPTTGSYVAQLTFMALAGTAIAVKTWWRALLAKFSPKMGKPNV